MEPISKTEYAPCEFKDKTVGMSIGPEFIAAIQKTVMKIVKKGPLIGYPVVNLRYVLEDGQTHVVDSNSNAFAIATHFSFAQGVEKAQPTLLEPYMTIEVSFPQDYQNLVIGGLVKRNNVVKSTTLKDDGNV
jgi:elongation factor G